MPDASEAIDAAISEVKTARSLVQRGAKQVRSVDAIATLKSTAYAWFNSHRPTVAASVPSADLASADRHYTTVLELTDKNAAKTTYLGALQSAKVALIAVRQSVLLTPTASSAGPTDDIPPDFSPLVGNIEMKDILTRRWHECCKCVGANAHLAAIVMMGGLLEALFVARANKLLDKRALVNAVSAPKEKSTGKTLNYQEWMLDSYIKVARELNWITESAKDVADILKEYRTFIHPEKERRHGVVLALNDSSMFWQVTKALARQLLASAGT